MLTDDQKLSILRHLAGAMGWKPVTKPKDDDGSVDWTRVYKDESGRRFLLGSADLIGWNPLESAEDALGLLEKVVQDGPPGTFTRLDYSPRAYWSCDIDAETEISVNRPGFCETITLACYRATGGTDVTG